MTINRTPEEATIVPIGDELSTTTMSMGLPETSTFLLNQSPVRSDAYNLISNEITATAPAIAVNNTTSKSTANNKHTELEYQNEQPQ